MLNKYHNIMIIKYFRIYRKPLTTRSFPLSVFRNFFQSYLMAPSPGNLRQDRKTVELVQQSVSRKRGRNQASIERSHIVKDRAKN